jgi:hypothetical protein
MTLKNAVFRDVTPCGSCKNRRFEGTKRLHYQGWRLEFPPKRRFLQEQHDVISQNTGFFVYLVCHCYRSMTFIWRNHYVLRETNIKWLLNRPFVAILTYAKHYTHTHTHTLWYKYILILPSSDSTLNDALIDETREKPSTDRSPVVLPQGSVSSLVHLSSYN